MVLTLSYVMKFDNAYLPCSLSSSSYCLASNQSVISRTFLARKSLQCLFEIEWLLNDAYNMHRHLEVHKMSFSILQLQPYPYSMRYVISKA